MSAAFALLRGPLAALLLAAAGAAFAAEGPEKALSGIVQAIEAQRFDQALERTEALIAAHRLSASRT
jgi:hypothetical protein